MKIEGVNKKPEPTMEELGTFKLKDREGRSVVEVDLSKATRPLTEAISLFIAKVHGENNKIKVMVKWKPKNEIQK